MKPLVNCLLHRVWGKYVILPDYNVEGKIIGIKYMPKLKRIFLYIETSKGKLQKFITITELLKRVEIIWK